MLCREIIVVCSVIHTKRINTLCGQNVELLNVKPDGTYRSFATTSSLLKICVFSAQTFKGFEVLQFSMSATTTQLLSSGELCKLCYNTIPVKSSSANVSFYTNNLKTPNFEL